jgi:ParB family chromosome partitioning protein
MAKKKVFQISNSLADGLEETITAAHNYSGDLRVEVIAIKNIEVDPENPRDLSLTFLDLHNGISELDVNYTRKREEIASLQSIANSIKEQGILNPIIVYKFGDKYRLVAGERRTLASILAGRSDIQAKILENKPNELKVSLLQWIENIERSDLTLWERLRNLEKIVTACAERKGVPAKDITVTELSQLIGCTKPHAMNYKAVLKANDELKQLILENKIRNLEKAALIAEITTDETRQHAIAACLSGATLKKLKVIATQSHAKPMLTRVSVEKRGRQATAIHLGATKNMHVARVIFDSILQNKALSHMTEHFKQINWNDRRSVTETFKKLLQTLEELHA